jgi:hypothetical protein
VQAMVTHCGTCGLPYDEKNTYWWKGHRKCRNCHRIRARQQRAKQRGESA